MASDEQIYLNLRFAYGGTIQPKPFIIVHSICIFLLSCVIIYKVIRRQISLNLFVTMKSAIFLYVIGELLTICALLTLNHASLAFRLTVIIHNMAETWISFNILYPFTKVIGYARIYLIVWFTLCLLSVLVFQPVSMMFFTGFVTLFSDVYNGLAGITLYFRSNNGMVKFFGLFSIVHTIAAMILFVYIANNWDNGIYWSIHSYYQIFYIYFLLSYSTKSDKELKKIGFVFNDVYGKELIDKNSDTERDEEQGMLNMEVEDDNKQSETDYNRGGIFASNKMADCSHFCKVFIPIFAGFMIFTFSLSIGLGNATFDTFILNENEYYWPGEDGLLDNL